jgi:hypothetical protein
MAESSTFPFVPQTMFVDIPEAPLVGDIWEGELFNERVSRGFIAVVTPASQQNTILIGANNPGDAVGVTIDGGLIQVVAGANAGATALRLETAIEAAGFLAALIDSVTVNAATVTINWADYLAHTVVEYSPAATTATVATPEAAVGQEQLLYGMGVVRKLPITTAMNTAIGKPTSVTDMFVGVLVRTHGTNLPAAQIEAAGFDPEFLCLGFAYSVAMQNLGVVVDYVGDAPEVGDPVYLIMEGANAGLWDVEDGSTAGVNEVVTLTLTTDGGTPGVSQESTLTVTSVADGDVGFSYDGLPALTLTATANATNDAASLFALYSANASYMAVTASIVDNLDGTLDIVFNDFVTHVFADESTGTSGVAQVIGQAAVADVPGDLVAFNYDGLVNLSIAEATGVVATDAANLFAQWNANPQYLALGSIVDNLDGTLEITFADFTTHAFTDGSGGTSTIVETVDTAAVAAGAATAKLIPNYSWGRPSITAGDPTRAFLRLSNP